MNDVFILDACALIALLAGEPGGENVKKIIQDAVDGNVTVKINQINLLEVYYYICNIYDQDNADNVLKKIKEFPIEIIVGLKEKVFRESGRIKSQYKIPLGDAILVAESIIGKWILVTSDHKDIERVEESENIKINWIRERLC
ncbi:MAG: PIN domain-containing protein [Planctomycetaceae bacterium]|nr:PIN domain-containing protein [Planctomycetaceae bacterium]